MAYGAGAAAPSRYHYDSSQALGSLRNPYIIDAPKNNTELLAAYRLIASGKYQHIAFDFKPAGLKFLTKSFTREHGIMRFPEGLRELRSEFPLTHLPENGLEVLVYAAKIKAQSVRIHAPNLRFMAGNDPSRSEEVNTSITEGTYTEISPEAVEADINARFDGFKSPHQLTQHAQEKIRELQSKEESLRAFSNFLREHGIVSVQERLANWDSERNEYSERLGGQLQELRDQYTALPKKRSLLPWSENAWEALEKQIQAKEAQIRTLETNTQTERAVYETKAQRETQAELEAKIKTLRLAELQKLRKDALAGGEKPAAMPELKRKAVAGNLAAVFNGGAAQAATAAASSGGAASGGAAGGAGAASATAEARPAASAPAPIVLYENDFADFINALSKLKRPKAEKAGDPYPDFNPEAPLLLSLDLSQGHLTAVQIKDLLTYCHCNFIDLQGNSVDLGPAPTKGQAFNVARPVPLVAGRAVLIFEILPEFKLPEKQMWPIKAVTPQADLRSPGSISSGSRAIAHHSDAPADIKHVMIIYLDPPKERSEDTAIGNLLVVNRGALTHDGAVLGLEDPFVAAFRQAQKEHEAAKQRQARPVVPAPALSGSDAELLKLLSPTAEKPKVVEKRLDPEDPRAKKLYADIIRRDSAADKPDSDHHLAIIRHYARTGHLLRDKRPYQAHIQSTLAEEAQQRQDRANLERASHYHNVKLAAETTQAIIAEAQANKGTWRYVVGKLHERLPGTEATIISFLPKDKATALTENAEVEEIEIELSRGTEGQPYPKLYLQEKLAELKIAQPEKYALLARKRGQGLLEIQLGANEEKKKREKAEAKAGRKPAAPVSSTAAPAPAPVVLEQAQGSAVRAVPTFGRIAAQDPHAAQIAAAAAARAGAQAPGSPTGRRQTAAQAATPETPLLAEDRAEAAKGLQARALASAFAAAGSGVGAPAAPARSSAASPAPRSTGVAKGEERQPLAREKLNLKRDPRDCPPPGCVDEYEGTWNVCGLNTGLCKPTEAQLTRMRRRPVPINYTGEAKP